MPKHLTVRCTEEEYSSIQRKANDLGMSLSEYVRFVSLHAKVDVRAKEVNVVPRKKKGALYAEKV